MCKLLVIDTQRLLVTSRLISLGLGLRELAVEIFDFGGLSAWTHHKLLPLGFCGSRRARAPAVEYDSLRRRPRAGLLRRALHINIVCSRRELVVCDTLAVRPISIGVVRSIRGVHIVCSIHIVCGVHIRLIAILIVHAIHISVCILRIWLSAIWLRREVKLLVKHCLECLERAARVAALRCAPCRFLLFRRRRLFSCHLHRPCA